MKNKKLGTALAAAAALAFTAGCSSTTSTADDIQGSHTTMEQSQSGGSSCKGSSSCKGANGCKGGGSCNTSAS